MENKFQEEWDGRNLTILPVATGPKRCQLATDLLLYHQTELIGHLPAKPRQHKVFEAMLLLQTMYFRLLDKAGAPHRSALPKRHICLHDAYVQCYRDLERILNRIAPPSIRDPEEDDFLDQPARLALGIENDLPEEE